MGQFGWANGVGVAQNISWFETRAEARSSP
jgi:hypothetical protein